MAGLLDIRMTKKITATVALEESTAIRVDRYAAFASVPADDVVNQALEYVFGKDKDFQQFLNENPNAKAPVALRIKKPVVPPTGASKPGRKPALASAN
jgi:hypothetical protein